MGNSSSKISHSSLLSQEDILQILHSIDLPLIRDLMDIVGSYVDQWSLPDSYFLTFPFSHEEIDAKKSKEYQAKVKETKTKSLLSSNQNEKEKRMLVQDRRIAAHAAKIYDCQVSNISTRIASVSGDGTWSIWDALSGECLFKTNCLTNWLMTCDMYYTSADNLLGLTGGLDNLITIYPIHLSTSPSSSPRIEFPGHDGYVSCARFLFGPQFILSSSGDRSVRLWDIENHKIVWTNMESTGGDVMTVDAINSDTYLSAGCDGMIHLLDSRQKNTNLKLFNGHEGDINSIHISKDQITFASASDDATCRVWDLRSGKELKKFKYNDEGLSSVVLSGSGQTVYCGSQTQLHVWDVRTGCLKQNI